MSKTNNVQNPDVLYKEAEEKDLWLYGLGNFPNNLIFMMVTMFIMYFYTDVLLIPPATAGTIFLVARIIDAITDPLMGMIVDRTNTKRFGKYKPYLYFGAPILGIAFVLMFTAPDLNLTGRIIYAYVTYIFYSLAWTVVQIPQLALPIILSDNVVRRTKIQAIFQAVGAFGGLVIQSYALPILNRFGGQDSPEAWTRVTIIFAIVSTILFILSTMSVRNLDTYSRHEASELEKKKSNLSFMDQIKLLVKNKALMMVLIAFGTDMFANQVLLTMRVYFFQYNMGGREDLMVPLGYVGAVTALLMLVLSGPLTDRLGKKWSIISMESLAIVFTALLFFGAPTQNVPIVMISMVATTILFGFTNLLSRAAIFDSANYGELTTGIAQDGLVSSTLTSINKFMQALSVFGAGCLLEATGYNASLTQQSGSTLNAILLMMTVVPIIAFAISVVSMWFYPLSRKDENEMEDKLKKMRVERANATD